MTVKVEVSRVRGEAGHIRVLNFKRQQTVIILHVPPIRLMSTERGLLQIHHKVMMMMMMMMMMIISPFGH
jgi:hypothetical protein